MQRNIFIRTPNRFGSPNEMAEHDHAPEAGPMQPPRVKILLRVGDEFLREKPAHHNFAEPALDERHERAFHPFLHRQNETGFRALINCWREKVAAGFDEQPFRAAVTLLFRGGQA